MEKNGGMNRLARVLQRRMQDSVGANTSDALDLGVISGDMSLVADNFPIPIPAGSYLVCRSLTISSTNDELKKTEDASDGHGAHRHSIRVPEKLRSLQPGDRVLIGWISSEAVVIDILEG